MFRHFKYLWIVALMLLSYLPCQGQQLTIYALAPPKPLNWKSPHTLLYSVSRNIFIAKNNPNFIRPMGHFVIELCSKTDTILTGIVSNQYNSFFESFFVNKRGMGILFDIFPGHLESESELRPELAYRAEKGTMAFVRFDITDSSFEYLKTYIDSFKHYGFDKLYNGQNKPLEGKGAGCAAFAMSFLELVGIFNPHYFSDWAIEVAVPDRLIGDEKLHRQVNPLAVYFSFNWAKKGESYTRLFLFEPQYAYNWIGREFNNKKSIGKPIQYKKAKGISFDARKKSKPLQDYYFSHLQDLK